MNEEDKLSKSDLDNIINQLKQTQEELAATIAVQSDRPIYSSQKQKRLLFKSWIWTIGIGVIVSLVILFGGYAYLQKEGTLKSSSVVESVQNLSTLATAQAQIKTIISKEDNKLFGKNISFYFPGTKRTYFLVASGEVTAGVDLKDLTKNDITLDTNTKEIHITLPHATIVQASIDSKNIQIFSSEGMFRNELNADEGFKQEDIAKQKMIKEAGDFGLLKTAENNARIALEDFFGNLNYNVTVTFK